ncbi:MAG: AAA domain-containing protein, partial [Promethearchaeota archaeon]
MNSKVYNIFEYLQAVKNLTYPPIRNVKQYQQLWCQLDWPEDGGIRLFDDCFNPEAWLEVDKVIVPQHPRCPKELEAWIDADITNPNNNLKFKEEISLLNNDEKNELISIVDDIQELEESQKNKNYSEIDGNFDDINNLIIKLEKRWQYLESRDHIKFNDDDNRVECWENYIDEWNKWRKEALPKYKIQEFYGELFALYQKLQREGDLFEIIYGHGLITWSINSQNICHPLLATRLELVFDYKHSRFYLIPTDNGTEFELNFLWDIDLPNIPQLNQVKDQYDESEQIPYKNNLIKPFFKNIVNIIDPKGQVKYDTQTHIQNIVYETFPVIFDAPLLILRKRATNLWQNELQKIKEFLKDDNFKIPLPLESLSSDQAIEEKNVEQIEKWKTVSEKILFPLASNSEQREIIRKLSKNCGVAVQGPPGTGKSHTIVNIISHLLAHGKRILVTAETSRALKVLGEMINKQVREISPLCISLLDRTEADRNELERSITGIHEGIANKNPDVLQKNINDIEKKIEKIEDEYFKIKAKIKENINLESSKINDKYNISYIAQKLAKEEEKYGWLPDNIPFDSNYIPKDNEIKKYFELINDISKSDIEQIEKNRPSLSKIPSTKEIHLIFNRCQELLNSQKNRAEILSEWDFTEIQYDNLKDSILQIDKALNAFKIIEKDWQNNLLKIVINNQDELNEWAEFFSTVFKELAEIRKNEKYLARYNIEYTHKINIREYANNLEIILHEFEIHGKVGAIFALTQKKLIDKITNNFKINDEKPELKSNKDCKLIKLYLKNTNLKNEFKNKWNNTIQIIDGPKLNSNDIKEFTKLDNIFLQAKNILGWRSKYISPIISLLHKIKHSDMKWTDQNFLLNLKKAIEFYLIETELNENLNKLNDIRKYIHDNSRMGNCHSIWDKIEESISEFNIEKYIECQSELSYLDSIQEKHDLLNKLQDIISKYAPNWIKKIKEEKSNGCEAKFPEDWKKAWEWSILNDWYYKHIKFNEIDDSYNRLKEIKIQKSKLTQQLIAEKAWLNLINNITPEERGALYPFLKAVQRITKSGRGKYDPIVRSEARNAMKKCAPAVPVWIMPIRKVLETLSPDSKKFDVVIIDESSQCDLFSLSVLFRGERVLIVGDDKQVSPQKPGVNIQQAYVNLKEKFLSEIPNVNLATWGPDVSLFDKAQEIFLKINSTVMLKEHFRCVPEIIQWSNDRFYNGKIEPLRYPKESERLKPPLKPVFIAEGRWKEETRSIINKAEAKAIVSKIKELMNDSRYNNKSMGVISLQGGMDQAFEIERLLRQEIGETEMQKRNLICGDSKHFQGDERDVMFLSMVAAPNERFQALTKKDAKQRFNVAVTRARDQIWLFHSVQFNDLSTSDLRYSLLEYFYNPKRVQIEMEKAEVIFKRYDSSKFHQEVYKTIVAKGYRAIPEFKVGNHPYRIDIVIEGINNRLAVECDGDAFHGLEQWEYDFNRQVELERAGFNFWRIRASKYYRNEEKALKSLWYLLDEMGIHPFEKKNENVTEAKPDEYKQNKKDNFLEKDEKHKHSRKITDNIPHYYTKNHIGDSFFKEPTVKELQTIILEILKNRPNNSCQKKNMTKEVLSVLGVIMKSNNRARFSQKVNRAMGTLKRRNYIEEYKTSK